MKQHYSSLLFSQIFTHPASLLWCPFVIDSRAQVNILWHDVNGSVIHRSSSLKAVSSKINNNLSAFLCL